jgi:hypothetical protein
LARREAPNQGEVEMRHVRHLVGGDDRIDDRRSVTGQRFADRALELARLLGLEPACAAGAPLSRTIDSAGVRYRVAGPQNVIVERRSDPC